VWAKAGDRAEARRLLSLASVVQAAMASTQHKDNAKPFRELCDRLVKEVQDYGEHR